MIDGKKVLALIPARGGSKGIVGKNIREVGGRPLIAWTIAAALKSKTIDEIILSSDNAEIIRVAAQNGCPRHIPRPAEHASDAAKAIDVIHSVQAELEARDEVYDILVLLQPTSPLRIAEDIDACVKKAATGANVVVSVSVTDPSPYWMFLIGDNGELHKLLPPPAEGWQRQRLPETVALNGAVYAADWDRLKSMQDFLGPDIQAYMMPEERAADIDTEIDLIVAEHYLAKTTR